MNDYLPADIKLRPMGSRIILEPLDWDASSIIIAIRHGRPVRGKVRAIGPGEYRKRYNKDRSKMYETSVYVPTEVKPGDIVELGGLNIFDGQGYSFQEIMIGGKMHLICDEKDVCGVRE